MGNRLVELIREMAPSAPVDCDGVWAISEAPTKVCGIYFLFRGDELHYIGQSKNIWLRMGDHHCRSFDRYAVVSCAPEDLDRLESLYIHLLRPLANGRRVWPGGEMIAPLKRNDLLTADELAGAE